MRRKKLTCGCCTDSWPSSASPLPDHNFDRYPQKCYHYHHQHNQNSYHDDHCPQHYHYRHLSPPVDIFKFPSPIASNGICGRTVGHKFKVTSPGRILMTITMTMMMSKGTLSSKYIGDKYRGTISVKLASLHLSLLMNP